MLYPISNASRTMVNLSGVWEFRFNDTAPWQSIAVPAAYNDQLSDPEARYHYGLAYYRTHFSVPRCFQGQRLVLRFDAVTHNAAVYVNGMLIGSHRGGFLPFEIEITDRIQPCDEVELLVEVDNRISHTTLPVGNEQGTAFFGSDNPGIPSVEKAKVWRGPQNLPNFDFFNYAGITRPVRLYTTPRNYIADITMIPSVSDATGIVDYEAECVGTGDVRLEILDAKGKTVASGTGHSGRLYIENASLWWPWPGVPYLYTARFTFGEDVYELPFGIRTVEVVGTQFLINGRPFYFKGPGRHEDYPVHGRGLDEVFQVKDVGLYHWLHANSFRTSHYPYSEEMYRLCDREGIVIIDEAPAVGINMQGEWNPYHDRDFGQYHAQVLYEMISRDKNHPCVVLWSLGNEPDTEHFPEDAYRYWMGLYKTAHASDPQRRPVTLVCCQNDYTKDITTRAMDVVCINRYYGWYNLSGDLQAAAYGLNEELDFWESIGKPVILSEYGADSLPGLHSISGEMFSEEFQTAYYQTIDDCLDRRKFIIGEQPWNFADFETQQGPMRAGGNHKGLFTRSRQPKMVAHWMKERWSNIDNFGYKGDNL